MANRNHKSRPGQSATPNNVRPVRSDKKVCALVRTAIHTALREGGVSIREAARLVRSDPSTIQRDLKNGLMIRYLRSHRLAEPFARSLLEQIVARNGRL